MATTKQYQFETIFVNKRGEIIETRKCEAYYYDEEVQGLPSQSKILSGFSEFEDSRIINIRMIYIPECQFWMGSHEDEKYPQHNVTVSSFFMSETPITEGQWRFVANLPQEQIKLNPNPSSDGDDHPVRYISWREVMEFCARLSRYTGQNYRLPSEAEWEYACRSVIGEELTQSEWNEKYNQPFHFGETITSKLANYDGSIVYQQEPKGKHRRKTTPVRTFKPNAFGLYDMHGNVWEWCLDPWHGDYKGAPNDGRVWDEGNEELYGNILINLNILLLDNRDHILRGGSWLNSPMLCHCTYRIGSSTRFYNGGFRIVCAPQSNQLAPN